jgi:hypothetical protein
MWRMDVGTGRLRSARSTIRREKREWDVLRDRCVILRATKRVTPLRNWHSDFKEERIVRAAFFSALTPLRSNPAKQSSRKLSRSLRKSYKGFQLFEARNETKSVKIAYSILLGGASTESRHLVIAPSRDLVGGQRNQRWKNTNELNELY